MHPRHLLTLAALLTTGAAFGQSTLDWADSGSWSLGASSGSYNSLSGSGSAGAAINTLTYDLGSGLSATVSVALDSGVSWQDGSAIYGGFAPRVTESGVFAFGVLGGSTSSGATLNIRFNQAVTLVSLTIGDIDDRRDTLTVGSTSGPLSVIGAATVAPTYSFDGGLLRLSSIATNEGEFSTAATTGWVTLSSGSTPLTDLSFALTGASSNHSVWLSSLAVSAAIPEPSTYAALLGVATLALVVWRRRARR